MHEGLNFLPSCTFSVAASLRLVCHNPDGSQRTDAHDDQKLHTDEFTTTPADFHLKSPLGVAAFVQNVRNSFITTWVVRGKAFFLWFGLVTFSFMCPAIHLCQRTH